MKNQLPKTPGRTRLRRPMTIAATAFGLFSLAGCGGNDDPAPPAGDTDAPAAQAFEVTMTNLTAGQPLSPAVAIVHDSEYSLFSIGSAASVGLERLAEGAETEPLLAELGDQSAIRASATSTGGPIGPGTSTQFVITVPEPGDGMQISLASMLVNTNDAIVALNGRNVGSLVAGQSMSVNLISYDTGTEANTETAASMPGPAAGGEGYNVVRDDSRDAVHVHAGVVSADDGLATSVLSSIHRWEHPVARLVVRRIR